MDDFNNLYPEKILTIIANNNTQFSTAFQEGESGHSWGIRYREIESKRTISFDTSTKATKVEVIIKHKNEWRPWVYVDRSTILKAGKGLFASRKFEKFQYFSVYMGQKVSATERNQGLFSNCAFHDRDPLDKKGRAMHWFLLSQFINHGNYTKSNCKFDPKLRGYTTKIVDGNNEFFMDYNRTIYCTTCTEKDKEDSNQTIRTATKHLKHGSLGYCSHCYVNQKQLVLRYCPQCRCKLCALCYDKMQISL